MGRTSRHVAQYLCITLCMIRWRRHGCLFHDPSPRRPSDPRAGTSAPIAPSRGAPDGRPRDGDGPRQEARNEHGRDELPPAQARIGRAGRGDRGRSRSGTLVARRASSSHGWTERDVAGDPDAEAASDWLRRHYLRSFVRRYERWFDRSADESLEWRDAAEFGDTELRLSSDTLRAFEGELLELLDRYRHPSPDDPDARRVAFYYHAFPIGSPDSEGLGACRMTILDVRSARRRYLLPDGSALVACRIHDPDLRPRPRVARPDPHRRSGSSSLRRASSFSPSSSRRAACPTRWAAGPCSSWHRSSPSSR